MNSNVWKGLAVGIGIGAVVIGAALLLHPAPDRAAAPLAEAPVASVANAADGATLVEVYKSPTCGCCGMWVEYMRQEGFNVVVHDVNDAELDRIQAANGVAPKLSSCHTALVKGYVVEGHVPAEDIRRLLTQRPKIVGLTVPGMVNGPPGMASATPVPYTVIAFTKELQTSAYAQH